MKSPFDFYFNKIENCEGEAKLDVVIADIIRSKELSRTHKDVLLWKCRSKRKKERGIP